MAKITKAAIVTGWVGVMAIAGPTQATPLEEQIEAAITLCAPFVEADGLPPQAGGMAGEELQNAWSDRYAAPPDPNLRSLQGLPLAVMTQGVNGCWVFGTHSDHTAVIGAAQQVAASNGRLRVTDSYDYGVSMDGSNAEMGITLRSSGGTLGRLNVFVGTYGPAGNGFYEVNVTAQ